MSELVSIPTEDAEESTRVTEKAEGSVGAMGSGTGAETGSMTRPENPLCV